MNLVLTPEQEEGIREHERKYQMLIKQVRENWAEKERTRREKMLLPKKSRKK